MARVCARPVRARSAGMRTVGRACDCRVLEDLTRRRVAAASRARVTGAAASDS